MSIRGPKIFEQGLNFDGLKLEVLRNWQSKRENRIKTGKLNRARGTTHRGPVSFRVVFSDYRALEISKK